MELLLRHGAYDIFNEVKAGTAEAESRAFVEQDIDTILERRSRTVVHENTGSQSISKGGTFSKARFTANSDKTTADDRDDVDIDDEKFWEKVVGYNPIVDTTDDLPEKRRRRTAANYAEGSIGRATADSEDEAFSLPDEETESPESSLADLNNEKRAEVRVLQHTEWKKNQFDKILKLLLRYGYGIWNWGVIAAELPFWKHKGENEVSYQPLIMPVDSVFSICGSS
jgi:hypothetical protein